jgi:hypothetical protein
MTELTRWEYLRVLDLTDVLADTLGDEGWELVGWGGSERPDLVAPSAWFKRPVQVAPQSNGNGTLTTRPTTTRTGRHS